MDIYLITGNKNKLRESEQILKIKLKNVDLDLDEIQELDSDKIAEHKVKQAWGLIKKPLFVWDQSLYIHCLNDFPGPLIKWFWTKVTLEKICQIANFFDDHKVYTKTTLTYYDGKNMRHFYGVVHGTIPTQPRGTNGFAWDLIFIPEGYDKTFAEMTAEEKNAISMHKIALEKLRDYLKGGSR
ncbi:MAG: non-canonical purine NTP pyrophosphatase [Nanoarchaeota archaeon]|nr:non-canonical purine NTP pyrophosphatase [Nanoarchaeota archaeon]MBU4284482.1 non-canonical purine NTP pyrophosphatase [Nanoarchaeota archaeon]MBU4493381.1 non-canonical purine NTP pyrophosphatase [Nanoarchaeota archaeon]